MWLARRERRREAKAGALVGPVTVPGTPAGAWLEGERRGVAVYAPGGYHWLPAAGEDILVLKTGESGESPCAVGVPCGGVKLNPGEVLICAGRSAIKLGLDGKVEVTGTLTVNGAEVEVKRGVSV